jgi:hypothetical protein
MSKTVNTAPAKPVASTNDSGRVKVGSGMIRFATTTKSIRDAGRVQVGSGMIRF